MLASVLQAASPKRFAGALLGHDRRTREARRHLQVIGTPPRISKEPTRATPPLDRDIKAITLSRRNASRGAAPP